VVLSFLLLFTEVVDVDVEEVDVDVDVVSFFDFDSTEDLDE